MYRPRSRSRSRTRRTSLAASAPVSPPLPAPRATAKASVPLPKHEAMRTPRTSPGGGVATSSMRPLHSNQKLRSVHSIEIVIVTSKGTFIVKAAPQSSIDWALEVASDLLMAANHFDHDEANRVVLVAARTATGTIAHEDSLVFDACRDDKILFAISEDEIDHIPPSFAHAFGLTPVTEAERQRALRLNPRPEPQTDDDKRASSASLQFSSRLRMSTVAKPPPMPSVESPPVSTSSTPEPPNHTVGVVPIHRPISPSPSLLDQDSLPTTPHSAVTMLNPFGAETDADVILDEEYYTPPLVKRERKESVVEIVARKLTRASAFDILRDILPAMPSLDASSLKATTFTAALRKTLQVANPESDSDDEFEATPSITSEDTNTDAPTSEPIVPYIPMPPVMTGPPPPPPPPGPGPPLAPSSTTSPTAPPSTDPNDLMSSLKGGSARNRLRKRTPPVEKPITPTQRQLTPEEIAALLEAERQDLFIELLGFMEAPNGNVEELLEKLEKGSKSVRSFVFLLVRRKWLDAVRVVEPVGARPRKPCSVWQGLEVTTYIQLKDVTEVELSTAVTDPNQLVARVHMYRYDEATRAHVMDEIALLKTRHFPKRGVPFTDPEPVGKNLSLEGRKEWDEWFDRKQVWMQSDFPQYELIFNKLTVVDETVRGAYHQLEQTLGEMKRMGEAMQGMFDGFSGAQLKAVIKEIPVRVKKIARELEGETGMILRAEELKITPRFLGKMGLSVRAPDGLVRGVAVAAEGSGAGGKEGIPNPKGSITMAGVPVDVLIPAWRGVYERKGEHRLTV
ncbi:hypothetical protein HDU98_011813 [Podochytrium sp. JEL0797]|nr:hypothetical protein HDU98_011813 [Podochytrium sp. JEL0797]